MLTHCYCGTESRRRHSAQDATELGSTERSSKQRSDEYQQRTRRVQENPRPWQKNGAAWLWENLSTAPAMVPFISPRPGLAQDEDHPFPLTWTARSPHRADEYNEPSSLIRPTAAQRHYDPHDSCTEHVSSVRAGRPFSISCLSTPPVATSRLRLCLD
jgi:hypothetical protein